jgi:hypothetical protein
LARGFLDDSPAGHDTLAAWLEGVRPDHPTPVIACLLAVVLEASSRSCLAATRAYLAFEVGHATVTVKDASGSRTD